MTRGGGRRIDCLGTQNLVGQLNNDLKIIGACNYRVKLRAVAEVYRYVSMPSSAVE